MVNDVIIRKIGRKGPARTAAPPRRTALAAPYRVRHEDNDQDQGADREGAFGDGAKKAKDANRECATGMMADTLDRLHG